MLSFLLFSFLLYNIFICIPYSFLDNSFNIYAKCPLKANTKHIMRDATESVESIGYGLFAVIKALFSNRNYLELIINNIQLYQ